MISTPRPFILLALAALAAACGGGGGAAGGPGSGGTSGTPPTTTGDPGTPPPAPGDPGAPPPGTSGSNRFQMGAAGGLYLVDPAQGEPAVQGLVVVTLGPVGTGNFIPPDDTVVTMNGLALLRDPALNGAYWRVDPAGPQPSIGSGGRMVLVATGTVGGARVQRTMVLPCPSDVVVTTAPTIGAALGSARSIRVTSAADVSPGAGFPASAGVHSQATLYGYDPATRALSPSGAPTPIGPGPLDVDLPVTPTRAPEYLVDLRWPGEWVIDGETGGFCGLAKRWTYTR